MIPGIIAGGFQEAAGGAATYLDTLAVMPRAVLSLRKLISTATASIRVRRSSDNTEQDIGFAGSALDTASLLAFAGGGSAYVVKVYDQTGNAEHLEQATITKQPRIVNAGSLQASGAFNAMYFDGGSHCMAISTLTLGSPQVGIYMHAALPVSPSNYAMIFELSPDFNTTGSGTFASYFDVSSPAGWSIQTKAQTGVRAKKVGEPLAMQAMGSCTTFLYDTTITGTDEAVLRAAGSVLAYTEPQNSEQTGSYRSDQDLFVGARSNSSLFTQMSLETLVIYAADTSGIVASIEAVVAGA